MPRLWIALGACVGVLTACGTETTSDLFRAPNVSAGATGGAFAGGGSGGSNAAGFGSGTGGIATGGALGFETGGATSSGGLVGQGGIINGSGGFAGAVSGGGNGGIAGSGGIAGNGGIPGDGGWNGTGGSSGDGGAVGTYATSAAAACNGTPCATAGGNACCVIVSTSNGVRTVYATCIPPGGTCSIPFSAKAFCDGPEDCARGAVCCATLGAVPGMYTELACVPAADCTGTSKQIMCRTHDGSSCASGVCNPTLTLPDSYGACG